jgi:hypothetical protein
MASYVGSMTALAQTDPTSGSWSLPGGWTDDDVAIFWWYSIPSGVTNKTLTLGSGVTTKLNDVSGGRLFVGWRRLVGGDTTFSWTADSVGSVDTIWGCDVFRGLAGTGDPFEGSPSVSFASPQDDPDPPAVVPSSDNTLVWTIFGKNDNLDSWPPTPPSGYTFASGETIFLGFDATAATAFKILSGGSGVSENPGAWNVDVSAGSSNVMWTTSLAVLPALTADAGPDQTGIILPPGTFTLAGGATGGTGGPYTYLWTQVSGPPAGVVSFTDDTDEGTTASASIAGTYVLEIEADDGTNTDTDTVSITIGLTPTGTVIAVDDVELTRVIEKIERRGIRITLALGSNWTCDLATYDNDSTSGAYRPNLRDNLSVDYEGQRLFKGPVTTRRDSPRARTNKGNICRVTAKANVLVSEQLQVDDFEAAAGQTLEQIVTALHTHGSPSLADHGIALDPSMPTGPTLAEVTSFDGVTFQQAFNRLMERTGSIIRITPDDVLQAFAPGDEVCAYALTATNGLARGAVTWEESSSKFVNRVTVEFGSGTFAVTETFPADGIDYSFPLAYTYVADFETVNNDGTQEIATRQGIGFDLAVQWLFYPPAVVGDPWTLRRETTGVPDPPAAGTITVTYLAQFPMRVTVEDAGSIATDGLWHRKYQRPDIFDIAEATEEADGLLRVNGATPKTITVRTREYPMPLPGDVINLNFPDRLIPDDDYLITRVAAEDYVDQKFEFVLTCVEGTEPQQSWTDTLKSLIGAG